MNRIALQPGLDFSRIVYGMWRLANDADTSPAHVQGKIEACLEQGITTFDQADISGGFASEAALGGALKAAPALRENMQIVTKCGIAPVSGKRPAHRVKHYDTSRAHIEGSLDNSLGAMGIEHVDLLLIHRPDPLMDHHDTGAALDGLVASGKVRAVGVSNFKPHDWSLLQSAMKTPLVTNQIEISLLESSGFTNGDVAFLQERGIAPMAWSPLAGGALFADRHAGLRAVLARIADEQGTDETAVAVAWLLAHPARIMPVMGTNNLERIRKLGAALDVEIDRQTWFELYAASGREVP